MSHRSKMLALGLATLIVLPGAALYATDADGVPTPQGPGPSTIKVEGSGSLTTLFAANNGFAGNTFDLENIGTEAITWDKP